MSNTEGNDRYCSAIAFLYELRWFGTKLGLENALELARVAGNPQDTLRFIHVAGTNGKGSTCAMIESIYRTAGLRVGMFTSPHLVSFRERIQVNRQWIPESDVVRLVDTMQGLLRQVPEERHPTFFETLTVMALRYFHEQRCDLVIWETGLGGRLDATNIVTPMASVITNIHYDHEKWLGNTLTDIATEKAGIIKPGIPVITGAEESDAADVISRIAAEHQAPLVPLNSSALDFVGQTNLPLAGEHQLRNAALAVATVQALQKQIPVSTAAISTGLRTVQWQGRIQLATRPSGQRILLDGAHNVAGTRALAAAVTKLFGPASPTLILGILGDKDYVGMCRILAPLAHRILLVPVQSERTTDPEPLAEACRAANPGASVSCCPALPDALSVSVDDRFLLITGSLYLVGEALELLELVPDRVRNERSLNEWGQARKTR